MGNCAFQKRVFKIDKKRNLTKKKESFQKFGISLGLYESKKISIPGVYQVVSAQHIQAVQCDFEWLGFGEKK